MKGTRITFAVLLYAFAVVLFPNPSFAGGSPGTRVVPATLPAEKKTDVKKTVTKGAELQGKAEMSKYMTPNIGLTVRELAVKTWFLGILGGDREYSASAPLLFKTPDGKVSENDVVRFIVLREALYTASSWSMGMARIESMREGERGMDTELYLPDIEPAVAEPAEEIAEKFRVEPPIARIIAEWKISSEISSGERIKNIRYVTVVKTAPINVSGVMSLSPETIRTLVDSPSSDAVKAIEAVKKHKITYAMPYVDNIAFIVKYSSSLDFPLELKKALE